MTVNSGTDIAAHDLAWDGCDNVRDLGGLPTADGSRTARGRIVRADNLDLLTENGWRSLWDYGVRTVIDLRNEEECRANAARPTELTTVRVPFDAYASADWIRRWDPPGLPQNMSRYLADYPQALVDFGRAVATARDGGIVVHCAAGRDRTGLASLLLLTHAGVEKPVAAADWEHSFARLRVRDDLGDVDAEGFEQARQRVADFLTGLRTEPYFTGEVRARLR